MVLGMIRYFFLEKYSKTIAEIDTEIKNKISHRAIALKKLSKFLEKNFLESSK